MKTNWSGDKFRAHWEAGDWTLLADLYAPDAVFDVTVGPWRYQRQGREALIRQLEQDYADGAAPDILRWHERPTPWGAVIEVEENLGRGDGQLYFRYVHLLSVDDAGFVTEDTIFCSGAWDRDTVERHRREAPMLS